MSETAPLDVLGAFEVLADDELPPRAFRASERIRRHMQEQAAEIERLRAELARLTPSGQVAEDAAQANGIVLAYCRKYCADDGAEDERHTERCCDAREAIPRLAAKAQGYEAAVATNAALLSRLRGARAALTQNATFPADVMCAVDILTDTPGEDHPGAALLKERQEREEVVKALGAFLASVQHVGPKGCPAGECGLCDALRLAGRPP